MFYLVSQRTYIVPRTATALGATTSVRGISNKNILLALAPGQVYSVDLRQIHPRRPFNEPSKPEKEEGLVMYNPLLQLGPLQVITTDFIVTDARHLISAATRLESTSLVFSYGMDLHFTRVQTSGLFDVLATDFNRPLLLTIVLALAAAVIILRNMYNKKLLTVAWA